MSHLSELNLHSAEFSTNIMSLVVTLQVAGLHKVHPSTTLDKSSIFYFLDSFNNQSIVFVANSISLITQINIFVFVLI